MPQPLLHPRDGIPTALTTPAEVQQAAKSLAAGHGPFAIDTERAAGFRYTDRAFLIQIRRQGAGTFLIDPEPQTAGAATPADIVASLGEVLNDSTWIIHAAGTDLPCLAALGLHPGELFDTELAARLAGFDHPNLANMLELLIGYQLAKGHGGEDWSSRPLPKSWLNYAALDVELLIELADRLYEILAEQQKLEFAYQEFEYIRQINRPDNVTLAPAPEDWRRLKGLGALRTPEQMVVARNLWRTRNRLAKRRDVAPGRILPNATIVAVARTLPRTIGDVAAIRGVPRERRKQQRLFDETNLARTSSPDEWPRKEKADSTPNHRNWKESFPEAHRALVRATELLRYESKLRDIPIENLLRPKILRMAAWSYAYGHPTTGVKPLALSTMRQLLFEEGARPWQVDITAPLVFFGASGQVSAPAVCAKHDRKGSSAAPD